MIYAVLLTVLLVAKTWQGLLPFKTSPMRAIDTVSQAREISQVDMMDKLTYRGIQADYSRANKRLILLDHDGTIKPTHSMNTDSDQARVRKALWALANDSRNEVWIITAADLSALIHLYGDIPNLNLAGCKGTQIRQTTAEAIRVRLPDASIEELTEDATRLAYDLDLRPIIRKSPYLIELTVFDENSDNFIAWSETLKEDLKNLVQTKEKFQDYKVYPVERSESKMRVVLKHKRLYNKGTLAKFLLEESQPEYDFGVSIGDLEMDEDMHREMTKKGLTSIIVKEKEKQENHQLFKSRQKTKNSAAQDKHKTEQAAWLTYATHRLPNHKKVIAFLEDLAGIQTSTISKKLHDIFSPSSEM
ncbi:hypothetical protein MJO29_002815 [Puccinia striiformis f. sp. tritici]|nr:hypothetical protein Pst134EA_005290 [Puccinia striiformis f. sp. tritici]KAH9471389.1 hypothetical protein Pst134EA_005290 [Puccinia striiformis f. sp. tritici]KAI7964717.1 hypothetical protein MJO29_002815 [Puccinia striiformis f. sp. tritici]KAI9619217.1 hypothetical protein H4Q26_011898 [Puccinia striiformis f. sp. tritici PST-130]